MTDATASEHPPGWPFADLREWIAFLENRNDLVRNETEADLRGDVSACAKVIADTEGPAILHEKIKGYPGARVFSDGLTARRRQAWGFGVETPEQLFSYIPEILNSREPVKPTVVPTGPCKEVVLKGGEVDLTALPIPHTGEYDIPPMLTSGVSNVIDPETGWQNSGIRRFQLKGVSQTSVIVLPTMHEGMIFAKYKARGEPMPVSIVIGTDPLYLLSTLMSAPVNFDEMDNWGRIAGRPLEVVRSEMSQILVPATSEIVIEGLVDPERRQLEGPFSEMPGYYSGLRMCPVVEVQCITMRQDAIYRYMYTGREPTEAHSTVHTSAEVMLYSQLKKLAPEIKDVAYVRAFGLTMALSIDKKAKKSRPGTVNRLAMLVKGLQGGVFCKNILVVDDDIDIRDPNQLLWAFSVRYQPSKDLQIVRNTPSIIIDPSEPWAYGTYGQTDFAIYDLTEKPEPYDMGYRSGVARPPEISMERARKILSAPR